MDPSRQSSQSLSTIMPRDTGFLGRMLWKLRERDAEGSFLYLMAVAVGAAMGLISTAFRWLVLHSHDFFSTSGHGAISVSRILPEDLVIGFQTVSPALGGLAVGLLVYRILNLRGGHGVPSVMKAVATGQTNLPASMAIKSATSPITITSGGSSGPEGPIVEIGAVIGSMIARKAYARRDQAGTLIGCGAAAGIAAVFNAPLGGVVFALELIIRDLQVRRFAPVVVSAVVASVISAALMPRHPAFEPLSVDVLGTIEPSLLLVGQFSVLGVLCGLAAVLLVSFVYKFGDVFNSLRIPLWTKPAVGGLMVGLIGLFLPQVMGEGNEFVNAMILRESVPDRGVSLLLLFLAVAVFKTIATAFTVGSGGTGGVFAPAMVTGAFAGAAVGILAEQVFPTSAPHFHVFAMTGMAGVVSSALGTPLAATLIVFEVAGSDYELMLPLMITVAVSSLVTARMKKGSVYTISLLRDGFDVDQSRVQRRDPLLDIRVGDIMARSFVSLRPRDNLDTILHVLGETEDNAFVVLDEADRLVGVISTNDLRAVVNLGEIGGAAIIAQDVADTNPPTLPPDATAAKALEVFTTSDTEGIPVVEPGADRRVVGLVSRAAVLQAYRKAAGEK